MDTMRGTLTLGLLAASATAVWAAEAPGLPPAPPYLQDGRPGRVTLVWRDEEPRPARVTVWNDLGQSVFHARVPAQAQSEVVVTGLVPGARHHWEVAEDGLPAREGFFKANPGPASTHMRFGVIGDMGSGDRNQFLIAARLALWKPEFVLTVGDNVYPGGEAALWGPRFFEPYGALMANAVFYPTLGNHDVRTDHGAPYLQALSLPQEPGGERYYAFDWGNARFWAMDSTQSLLPGSPQYQWLLSDVTASRARWKVVFFHHPPYSSGLHGEEAKNRGTLGPLFAKLGVNVVFNGHDHHYERSEPEGGVVYVTTGGGGAMLYGVNRKAFSAHAEVRFHFMGVSIDGDTLGLQAIDDRGRVFDAGVVKAHRS